MPTRYLLPCQCGERLPVDVSQAGLQLACQCGKKLEVPTLRGLKRLETENDKAAAEAAPWTARQGLITFGVLIMLTGVGIAGWKAYSIPPFPELPPNVAEITRQYAHELSLEQTFKEWDELKLGLNKQPSEDVARWELTHGEHQRWIYVGIFISVVGLTISLFSLFSRGPPL